MGGDYSSSLGESSGYSIIEYGLEGGVLFIISYTLVTLTERPAHAGDTHCQ